MITAGGKNDMTRKIGNEWPAKEVGEGWMRKH
jgi:hypothetical protein